MAKDKDSLRATILKVIDYLQVKIELETVILFGSYVEGAPHEYSDIDLAIVSPDFARRTLEEKAKLFSDVKLNCDVDVEIHFYSPHELTDAGPASFLGHIVGSGKFYVRNKRLVA